MQNNLNLNDLLKLELDNNNNNDGENICLITNETLDVNHIEFICKHKFNYDAIFNEICKQKIQYIQKKKYGNHLEVQKLTKYQMKCPYCRKIQNGILPHKNGYNKLQFINWPPTQILKIYKCSYVFVSGKKKTLMCNKPCEKKNCTSHLKILEKRKLKEAEKIKKQNIKKDIIKCTALTKKGTQCSRKAAGNGLCHQHFMNMNTNQTINTLEL